MTTTVSFVARCVCGDIVEWTATPSTAVPLCDCTDNSALPDASTAPLLVGDVGQGGPLEDAA